MATPNYPIWVPTLAPACPVRILRGVGGRCALLVGGPPTRFQHYFSVLVDDTNFRPPTMEFQMLRAAARYTFPSNLAQFYHSHFGREPALPGASVSLVECCCCCCWPLLLLLLLMAPLLRKVGTSRFALSSGESGMAPEQKRLSSEHALVKQLP